MTHDSHQIDNDALKSALLQTKVGMEAILGHLQDAQGEDEKERVLLEVRSQLEYLLCKLTYAAIPEAPRKMGEIIRANELQMTVLRAERGADMETSDGSKIEQKTSYVTKGSRYKCNINIPFPGLGKPEKIRRALMLASIYEKTCGPSGGMDIVIRNKTTNEMLNEYFLSHSFMMAYFEDLCVKNFPSSSNTVNWGRVRCSTCLKYHILERMVALDAKMKALSGNPLKLCAFRTKDPMWIAMVNGAPVPGQCK